MSPGVTLDAGPLIALDRADRRVIVLLARAEQTGASVIVPGAALAQAIRDTSRQARLPGQPRTQVAPLDGVDATDVGRLLAASGTSDIADAHVVVCARRPGTCVVIGDPEDPRRLDPTWHSSLADWSANVRAGVAEPADRCLLHRGDLAAGGAKRIGRARRDPQLTKLRPDRRGQDQAGS